MTRIIESNVSFLFEARLAVDGPFDDEAKVRREVLLYANGEDRMRAFVCMSEDKVTGYIEVVGIDDDMPQGAPILDGLKGFGHIARIGVVESERGKGNARALLNDAMSWLKTKGALGVWLDYLPHNRATTRLYERNGFQDVAEFRDPQNRIRRITAKRF